ncbi:DUF3000 domain-containing protein [Aestuariimicrobium ganziense]|uniref:DUF3000 domain-containing protein n=1 Tax=Aestuariimicrobium ganziense TaxID=2773677 RepID=UPI002E29F17F|nr:DUF3000 domain-containing protein [Aestuariimicrobium ganziense]
MSAHPPSTASAAQFRSALADLLGHRWRAEVHADEIPAPQKIAPHSAAIAAEVTVAGTEVGNGRLVLLHDPAGNEAWQGTYRLVSFARADVDQAMVTDPLLTEVGWAWLTDALDQRGAPYAAASGTVTSVVSRSFGGMSDEPDRAEVEIRASWTPLLGDGAPLALHVAAWEDLLCLTSGLSPLPEGIVQLTPRTTTLRPW